MGLIGGEAPVNAGKETLRHRGGRGSTTPLVWHSARGWRYKDASERTLSQGAEEPGLNLIWHVVL